MQTLFLRDLRSNSSNGQTDKKKLLTIANKYTEARLPEADKYKETQLPIANT